jgi:GntR family transcriptional regulator, transcriptional repressor for pyruvate dehydrogenase complex
MIQSPADRGQHLVKDLLRQIQADGLAVGDRLPSIRRLAQRMGLGASAVRDAMLQAQTLGLVKIHPRSGAFVQSLTYAPLVDALASTLESSLLRTDRNLFHLLEARQLIEGEMAWQAAQRRRSEDLLPLRESLEAMAAAIANDNCREFVEADVNFHLTIAAIAGNSVLQTTLRAILSLLRPYLMSLPWTDERQTRTDRSHAEIYEALVAGDGKEARARIDAHLGLAYNSLLAYVRNPPLSKRASGESNVGVASGSD